MRRLFAVLLVLFAGSVHAQYWRNSSTGSTQITTLGTITTGTWNASVISPVYGGTGVANNAAQTLTRSGNHALTITTTGTTGITLPTSGTIATTADYVGATAGTPGVHGLVPAAAAGDQGKFLNGAGAWVSNSGIYDATNVSITGTSINGTVIGGITPAAGSFTTVTANSFIPNSATVPTNGIYLPAGNTLAWATNSTKQASLNAFGDLTLWTGGLYIDKSGTIELRKTGESQSSPSAVYSPSDNSALTLYAGTSAGTQTFIDIRGNWNGVTQLGGYIRFGVANVEKARITLSGNLLIGTTTETASAGLIQLATGTTAAAGIVWGTDSNLYRTGAAAMRSNSSWTFDGSLTTGAPTGGTAAAWKMGVSGSASITSPDKYITVDVGGTLFYVPAKLTAN